MLLALPLTAFVVLFLILHKKGTDRRKAILSAAVFWATCLTAITEMLSLLNGVTRGGIAISWLVICVAGILYIAASQHKTFGLNGLASRPVNKSLAEIDRTTKSLLFGVVVIVSVIGVTSIVAPPCTWDAMEYHLPRTTMWMSNHNVNFFPTPDYCQLIYGPWAEYAMMHTELLFDGDRFVNLIQVFSLMGSLVGVSLIAKCMGAGPRGQALAVVVCATIPEGVLEASGAMNTYVVSFWITTTAVFLLLWNEDPSWFNTICAGLAAGLALFTKGTAYIVLPFVVLGCWWAGTSSVRALFLRRSAAFSLPVVLLNAPLYWRNFEFSGSPLGFPLPVNYPRTHTAMDHISVLGTLANVLRNLSLHLCSPSVAVNMAVEKIIRLAITGLGANPDDPSAIYLGERFHMNHFTSNEIIAGNPLHLALLLAVFGFLFLKWRQKSNRMALWFGLGLVSAFIAFSAVIRWTMWSSRYQLVLFVLGSALCGFAMERYFKPTFRCSLAVILLVMAFFFAVVNRSRSLIPWQRVDDVYHPRSVLYFSDEHERVAPTYIAMAEAVNQLDCPNAAIDSYTEDPEIKRSPASLFVYPLFALIHANGRSRSVWYTGVNNLSSRYASRQKHAAPCAVVCLDCAKVQSKWTEYQGVGGRASVFDNVVVFSAVGAMTNARSRVVAVE
jgi:hypothetical protein